MKTRVLALLAAVIVILGAGTAYAGDTVLFTPMLSPPVGGKLACNVTNVGKKTLTQVTVIVVSDAIASSHVCNDLTSAVILDANHTCHNLSATDAFCMVKITGGSYRSVRAVLNVEDSSGATILSVPATK